MESKEAGELVYFVTRVWFRKIHQCKTWLQKRDQSATDRKKIANSSLVTPGDAQLKCIAIFLLDAGFLLITQLLH